MSNRGNRPLHAAGICDCCDGPTEDEGTPTDFSEEAERLQSLRKEAEARGEAWVFVSVLEDWEMA